MKFPTTLRVFGECDGNRTRRGRGWNPGKQEGFGLFTGGVDQDIDQPYRHRSSLSSQIVERWCDLSDKLKRAFLKMHLAVDHPSSARIFRKYDRAKVTFGSNDGRKRAVCLVCHPSGYSILIDNGFDHFRNFLSRLSGGGSEQL